jgi:hypothetical protein
MVRWNDALSDELLVEGGPMTWMTVQSRRHQLEAPARDETDHRADELDPRKLPPPKPDPLRPVDPLRLSVTTAPRNQSFAPRKPEAARGRVAEGATEAGESVLNAIVLIEIARNAANAANGKRLIATDQKPILQ